MDMRLLRNRIGYTVVGAGLASAIAVGGAANAAPTHPVRPALVPGTHCTDAQVDRALAHEDPALWHRIESNPKLKRRFEHMLTLTPQQRKAMHQKWAQHHPVRSEMMKFLRHQHISRSEMARDRAAVMRAKQTCGQF